jgi:SAM-dependent methyltransferase
MSAVSERTGEWYERFFDALANDVWEALVPAAVSDAEAAFLDGLLTRRAGRRARVLDAPSGSGRIATRLATWGRDVTAVDLSVDAIERLRRWTASSGLSVDARVGDIRDLGAVLAGCAPFDLGICWGNSFGYLDPDATTAFVAGLYAALAPGARLAVDHPIVAECILPNYEGGSRHEVGDVVFVAEHRYDPRSSTMVSAMTLERAGERSEREVRHRVTTCREVVAGLERAGFAVERLLGDLDGREFALGDHRLVVVASRP